MWCCKRACAGGRRGGRRRGRSGALGGLGHGFTIVLPNWPSERGHKCFVPGPIEDVKKSKVLGRGQHIIQMLYKELASSPTDRGCLTSSGRRHNVDVIVFDSKVKDFVAQQRMFKCRD